MTTAEPPRPRGRPASPSLATQAVTILERNAFAALRGPTSRGAVPRSAFDGVNPSTVDRSVKRSFPDEQGRTPFDLASHHLSGLDGPTRATLEAVFEVVEESFRTTDRMETTLRVFLQANFTEACREDGLLAGVIVQTAACAYLESRVEPGGDDHGGATEQMGAAREVVAMRRQHYRELIDGFAAGLAIALRRLRRRPKSAYAMRDIVLAVFASSDGFVLMHKLDPGMVDADLVVESQWNLIWGMSEPGLLDPPNRSNPVERHLVEAALTVFTQGHLPVVEDLARTCGVDLAEAEELFPTVETLAQRCMDYAVSSSVETQAIAVGVTGAELSAVRDLLIATTRQADASPVLIDLIRRDRNIGFCAEARRHVAEALDHSQSISLAAGTAEGVATMLVDAALQGAAGKPVWQAGLDAFNSRS